MMPFLVYMYCTCLTFEKPFLRKQDNVLIFLIISAKSVEVPVELSKGTVVTSVPTLNGYTCLMLLPDKSFFMANVINSSFVFGKLPTKKVFERDCCQYKIEMID